MIKKLFPLTLVALVAIFSFSVAQPVTGGGGLSKVTMHGSGGLVGSGTTTNPAGIRRDCGAGSGVAWDGDSWECAAIGGGGSPSVLSPTAITGTINDWAPASYAAGTTAIRIDTSGTVILNGLTGGSSGRILYLEFIGANNVTIANQATASTVANRFITGTGTDLTFTQSQSIGLIYDNTTQRWRIFAYPDNIGNGDITGITAGNGLTGDTTSGTASLAVGAGTNITVNADDVQLSTNVAVGGTLSVSAGATTVSDFRGTEITPSGLTGTINDWAPSSLSTATIIHATSSGSASITGLTGGSAGRKIILCNAGTQLIFLLNENGSSTPTNRFQLPASGTLLIPYTNYWGVSNGYECVELIYNGTTSRWNVTSQSISNQNSLELASQLYVNGVSTFVGTATANGSFVANGDSTFGNADSDNLNTRASLGVSGTDATVSGTGCSITGEGQSFRLTVGSGGSTTSCVVTYGRTMTAPYCVFSPADADASEFIANDVYAPYISAENTTTMTFTLKTSVDTPAVFNFWCPTRF